MGYWIAGIAVAVLLVSCAAVAYDCWVELVRANNDTRKGN